MMRTIEFVVLSMVLTADLLITAVASAGPSADLYDRLGVSKTASFQAIKASYIKIRKSLEGPALAGDEAALLNLQLVGHAWNILKRPETRQLYDRYGTDKRSLLIDSFDHQIVEAIHDAVGSDQNWEQPEKLDDATIYFLARPHLMAHFLTIEPNFGLRMTAQFYKEEKKAREFYSFLINLRKKLISIYANKGNGRGAIDPRFLREISLMIYDPNVELNTFGLYERLNGADLAAELIEPMKLSSENVLSALFQLAWADPLLDNLRPAIRFAGPYLTPNLQEKIWKFVDRPHEIVSPLVQVSFPEEVQKLREIMFDALLASPINDHTVRDVLFEKLLKEDPSDNLLDRTKIAGFFVKNGNVQERSLALKHLRPKLRIPIRESYGSFYAEDSRIRAIAILIHAAETRQEALSSLQGLLQDARLEISAKVEALTIFRRNGAADPEVHQLYQNFLDSPAARALTTSTVQLFKPEDHGRIQEKEWLEAQSAISKYLEDLCRSSLGGI